MNYPAFERLKELTHESTLRLEEIVKPLHDFHEYLKNCKGDLLPFVYDVPVKESDFVYKLIIRKERGNASKWKLMLSSMHKNSTHPTILLAYTARSTHKLQIMPHFEKFIQAYVTYLESCYAV